MRVWSFITWKERKKKKKTPNFNLPGQAHWASASSFSDQSQPIRDNFQSLQLSWTMESEISRPP
jgi:hypothetical protein